MSPSEREDPIPGIEDVARAYERAGFQEQPPPHVDRAVLRAADRRRARLPAFVPALALAATLALSFSLMLRGGLLGLGEAPEDSLPRPMIMEQSSSEESADDGADAPAAGRAPRIQPRLEESTGVSSRAVEDTALECRVSSGGVPAEWLACISRQLAAGAEQTAREELDDFLRDNPEYPLPDHLRMLREP